MISSKNQWIADMRRWGRAAALGALALGGCALDVASDGNILEDDDVAVVGQALSTGVWNSSFSDANGWTAEQYYSTIGFPDATGGGLADVCGRGGSGINCAVSNGSAFVNTALWNSSFSDANGWNLHRYYSTIAYPDLNNDGRADVCGRGGSGINCAKSNGSAFTNTALWNSSFSDANGWTLEKHYGTIRYPDVNGGGLADVCGRGGTGIFCATSNGNTFGTATLWNSSFSDANGWGSPQYFRTISFQDLDNDSRADVCGRGSSGINCAKSNGSSFTGTALWNGSFSDANGWAGIQYYSTIRFPDLNGDNRADVCGRGQPAAGRRRLSSQLRSQRQTPDHRRQP